MKNEMYQIRMNRDGHGRLRVQRKQVAFKEGDVLDVRPGDVSEWPDALYEVVGEKGGTKEVAAPDDGKAVHQGGGDWLLPTGEVVHLKKNVPDQYL